jgi:hypothetical protein
LSIFSLEADKAQHLRDLRLDDRARLADALEGEGDVLVGGLVGQQLEVLEDAADLAAQVRDLPVAHLVRSWPATNTWPLRGLELAVDAGG